MTSPNAPQPWMTLAVTVVSAAIPAAVLTLPHGIGIAVAGAVLLYVIGLSRWREQLGACRQEFTRLALAFGTYFFASVLSTASSAAPLSAIDNPSRFLLALPLVPLIFTFRPALLAPWLGMLAGVLGAALIALYQFLIEGLPRAKGFSQEIMFGNLSLSLGLLLLAGWPFFRRWRLGWLVPPLGFAAGVLASMLSGSRGGWLAFGLVAIPFYYYCPYRCPLRATMILGSVMLALLFISCLVPQSGVMSQIDEIFEDITAYTYGYTDTSIGARLELGRSAWHLFIQNPLTGVGIKGFQAELQHLAAVGKLDPALTRYNHAHNEFLNALATGGIIGFAALAGVFVLPMRFFLKHLGNGDAAQRAFALAGFLLTLLFGIFCLTQDMFAHQIGAAFYAFMVSALVGFHASVKPASEGPP